MLTKVRINPWLGIVFLVLGSTIVLMALFTGIGLNLITAGVLIILGILYLVNPMLKIDEEKIQMLSPAGIKGRAYYYGREAVRVEGKKIWIGDKRLRATSWMAHPKDWAAFMDMLRQKAHNDKDLSAHLVE